MFTFPTSHFSSDINLRKGMLHYWELDEASGTTAFDTMGNSNGTHTSVSVNEAPKTGSASCGYLSGRYTTIGTDSFVAGLANITISAWVKQTNLTGTQGISGAWATAGNNKFILRTATTQLQFYTTTTSGQVGGNITAAPTAGSWYHVIAEYDGSNMRLFVNGSQAGTTPAQTGNIQSTTGSAFYIGRATTVSLIGNLDQVCIWNRVLTSDEKAIVYNSGTGRVL